MECENNHDFVYYLYDLEELVNDILFSDNENNKVNTMILLLKIVNHYIKNYDEENNPKPILGYEWIFNELEKGKDKL